MRYFEALFEAKKTLRLMIPLRGRDLPVCTLKLLYELLNKDVISEYEVPK